MDRQWWGEVEAVDIDRPSAARIYDYVLGGSANLAVDREFAEQQLRVFPEATRIAVDNRAFLARAVRFCVRAGIRQFLDVGSGIPTVGNVHEIAQGMDPTSTVVYVDNDPVAVSHSRRLLEGNDRATAVRARVQELEQVLEQPQVLRLLDFERPIALLMVALLHFVPDGDAPAAIVRRCRESMPSGSYLVVSHGTHEGPPQIRALAEAYRHSSNPAVMRTHAEIARLLDGFELVTPGLVHTSQWRAESTVEAPEWSGCYAAVGRRAD